MNNSKRVKSGLQCLARSCNLLGPQVQPMPIHDGRDCKMPTTWATTTKATLPMSTYHAEVTSEQSIEKRTPKDTLSSTSAISSSSYSSISSSIISNDSSDYDCSNENDDNYQKDRYSVLYSNCVSKQGVHNNISLIHTNEPKCLTSYEKDDLTTSRIAKDVQYCEWEYEKMHNVTYEFQSPLPDNLSSINLRVCSMEVLDWHNFIPEEESHKYLISKMMDRLMEMEKLQLSTIDYEKRKYSSRFRRQQKTPAHIQTSTDDRHRSNTMLETVQCTTQFFQDR